MTHAKQTARIVIDLGFGDAGKGSIVDYFAHTSASDLVIRFNGGAQAAHNVITESVHHTFRQFGSGTLRRARTLYSRHALLDPLMLLDEAQLLEQKGVRGVTQLFVVEEDCVITTVFQQAMNRIRELTRKDGRHGSCGLGIGETASDKESVPHMVLTVKDLADGECTHAKLEVLRVLKLKEAQQLSAGNDSPQLRTELAILGNREYSRATTDAYQNIISHVRVVSHREAVNMFRTANAPIFEGAQGILLDQNFGFYPYITRSDVTPKNAIAMCEEAGMTHEVTGLLRAYAVRHGPGPMPTEDAELTETLSDYHNAFGEWQREFRVGYFDAMLARYAIDICRGVDNVMITCTDRLAEMVRVQVCNSYRGSALPCLPSTLASMGKEKTKLQTQQLMEESPVYADFISSFDPSSLEYQHAYALHVLALVSRKVRLLGISRGTRSSDKYLT